MADRQRSTDGRSETEEVLGQHPEEMEQAPGAQGRSGGNIARKTGTRDEEKRHDGSSAGATRPLGQDQNSSGDKESV